MRSILFVALLFCTFFVQSQNKITIKKTPQHVDTFAIEGDSLVISLSGDSRGKKKVFLSTGSGGSITYVPSIDSLRNYPGNTTKLVIAKGYYNGLQYGGGPFTWYATDITGRGDDGGISIAAPSGYWVRVDRQFRATYFGMVDTSDLATISKTHNTREAEKLTNVIPEGSKLIFDPGFTFKSYGGFVFGQDDYKTVHVEGYGAILTRGNQIQDSIKSNSTSWVRVAHPERWDTFMYVAAYDGTDRMITTSKITRIGGDTLFVAMGSSNYATGDLYTQSFQMSFNAPNCTLRGLTFDGNLAGNQIYNYWGTSGALYLSSENAFANRISVRNSPGEGILLFEDNVIIDGFNIQNCDGNGIHTGSNSNYQILNGVIKQVNNLIRRDAIETMGHEGGAIAHSVDVHGGMVSNIQIDSAYAAIADVNGGDDSLNVYDRIDAKNCNKAVEFSQGFSQGNASHLKVTNSRFYNCGAFEIKSNPTGPADSSEYIRDIVLDNVQLFNTYFDMNARSYNVTMNNIYVEDTSATTYHIELSKHLKINGLVKIGGGKIYMSECNRSTLENFEIRETNSSHSAIDFTYSENAIIRNGAIYQTSAASGFVGIYGGIGNEISDVFIDLKGSPTYGIFANASSTTVATTVKNCTVLTPTGVPSIRCYGGSSGGLFINNKVNNDISNIASNDDYGTINVTDDDITWGNTTTIKLLGKIRDSAGNLGTDGQVLTADASGFTVWETPSGGGGGLTGSGTTNKVTKWTGASTLGNSQITDDGADVTVGEALGKITLNVGSSGSNGIDYKRGGVVEGSLNTAVYNTTYNGSMFGHNLSQAFAHINTTLNAYYMDLGGRGSSGIGGTSSGIFFGMKAASTSTETNLLTLDENGNVGIGGVTAPAQKLHVSGTARITGSDGTATTITGRDGDGDISNVSLGYGLNLVGGILEVDTTEVATPGDLASLGGSGDITSVTADPYLTGGGTTGAINIGVDTTGTVGLATKYDISGKPSGSGSASRVPYWFNASTLTSEEQMMISNAIGNYIFGIGYTGGNGQFDDDLEAGASGYVAYDATIAGIGMHVNEHQWEIAAKRVDGTNSNLVFTEKGGSWPATPLMTLSNGGELTLPDVAGTGTRVATASSTGAIGALTNGSNGQYLGISGGALAWGLPTVSEVDGVIGNEITNVGTNGLVREGSGTGGSPYTVRLPNGSGTGQPMRWTGANTWAAATFGYAMIQSSGAGTTQSIPNGTGFTNLTTLTGTTQSSGTEATPNSGSQQISVNAGTYKIDYSCYVKHEVATCDLTFGVQGSGQTLWSSNNVKPSEWTLFAKSAIVTFGSTTVLKLQAQHTHSAAITFDFRSCNLTAEKL